MVKDKSKLQKVDIVNKIGKHQSVWKKILGDIKVNRLPPADVDPNTVKVNLKGNIHSHSVLTWKHPKTGYSVHSYTIERMKKQNEKKWQRQNNFTNDILDNIKKKTIFLLKRGKTDSIKQVSAVINIMANTGLRRGERFYRKMTGNKGVLSLHPNDVIINDDVVKFFFMGKSYQENRAKIKDPVLANYLLSLKEKNKDNEFLFDVSTRAVNKFWDWVLGMKKNNFLMKDLRTKVAENKAEKSFLKNAENISKLPLMKQKKVAKELFNKSVKEVSKVLNNTMGIAKGSYIHPKVIKKWMKKIGLAKQYRGLFIKKSIDEKDLKYHIIIL